MTHRCGGILRSMTDTERRQQMDRLQDDYRIKSQVASPDAAAPPDDEDLSGALQPEQDGPT